LPKTKSLLGTMNFPCTVDTRKLRLFSSLIPRYHPFFGAKFHTNVRIFFFIYPLGKGGSVGGEGMVKFQRKKSQKKFSTFSLGF
jgi:hypothetical protein